MAFGIILNKIKRFYSILGFFMIFIMLLSVESQIQLQTESLEVFHTEVVILQVGSDENVQLAVDTFLKCYPNKKAILIKNIQSENDLFFYLDYLLGISSHVIFGHGTRNGLAFPEGKILAWDILNYHIETLFELAGDYDFVPVMACYSGIPGKHYGGWRLQLDATYAGVLAAELICMERDILFDSKPARTVGVMKQRSMENPLFVGYTFVFKFVDNGEAAFIEAEQDRAEMGGKVATTYNAPISEVAGWRYQKLWPGYGLNYAEDNPHIIDIWYYDGLPMMWMFYISSEEGWNREAPKGPPHMYLYAGGSIFIIAKAIEDALKESENSIQQLLDGVVALAIEFWEKLTISLNNAIKYLQQNPTTTANILMMLVLLSVMGLYVASGGCVAGGIFTGGFTWKEALIFGLIATIGAGWILSGEAGSFIESVSGAYPNDLSSDTITDNDNDKLPLIIEETLGTSDSDSDTDNDGLSDLYEYKFGFDPLDSNNPTQTFLVDTIRYGSDEITMSAHGLKLIDKMEIIRNSTTQSCVNVSTVSTEDYELEITGNHEMLIDYYVQNNTVGTEWVKIGTEEFLLFDLELLGETPDDHDTDGVYDTIEMAYGTNPFDMDSDDDGLTDDEELFIFGTDPNDPDTDNDGLEDGEETCIVSHFPNIDYISEWDTDEDSIPNWFDLDSDGDGLNDSYEDTNNNGLYDSGVDLSNFLNDDTDNDDIDDKMEFLIGTDPNDDDTDKDGLKDGWELSNSLDPLRDESNDWKLFFGDDFSFTSMYDWEDSSTYGSMRAGGLATTTVYNNAEADEDFVVRVFNSSTGDWALDSSAYPQITQYQSSSQFYGFVVSWNLSELRSNAPAEAIESATIDLNCYSYSNWDSTDDIYIALVNLCSYGSILNDSSTTAHVNYSMWHGLWYQPD